MKNLEEETHTAILFFPMLFHKYLGTFLVFKDVGHDGLG